MSALDRIVKITINNVDICSFRDAFESPLLWTPANDVSAIFEIDLPMHTPQPDYLEAAPAFVCGPELVRQKERRLIEL